MKYRIEEVKGLWNLIKFIKFPNDLYRNCPQYVPSLYLDQIKTFTSIPAAKYCKHTRWVVKDEKGRIVGRICAMVNPKYNERYGTRRARFGWFDTIEDIEVARLLLSTAEKWALEQGMEEVHGPLFYNTMGKQGMLFEGYENIPPYNCYYNFPYYNDFMEQLGYTKELDWIQLKLLADQRATERTKIICQRLTERYKLHYADIDKLKRSPEMIQQFFRIYSESFAAAVPNFIPFTDEEIREEAASAASMIDKRLCCVVMNEQDEIAAFGVAFPSISKALQKARGSMLRMGLELIKAKNDLETIDLMLLGAAPRYQNTGVSAVIYTMMGENFADAGSKIAISNPQIETNKALDLWDRYQREPFMKRRCYIRNLVGKEPSGPQLVKAE